MFVLSIPNSIEKETAMLVSTENYLNSFNPEDIPLPDWTHLGVKTVGTEKISWDQIYVDDINGNTGKVESHTPEEIENLRLSFAEGVVTTEFPPAVVYRGSMYDKPWELRYGFGRSEALRILLTTAWYFTVLEGTEDALEDVQAAENEGLPKRLNQEVDMRKFLIQKVLSGKTKRSQEAIRAKFRLVYPNRKKEVENRIVPQVMEALGIETPYILYTSTPKVQDWLKNHSRKDYVVNGEFDNNRKMYGTVMKEGYQYRTIWNAIKNYTDTGYRTYVIYHCGAPTKKSSLNQKRKQVIENFEDMRRRLEKMGLKKWPIVYMGALPQDRENDDMKELV
jgi:hypothetical protein